MLYAEGFDPGRDLLELGERLGVVSKNGSWYAFDGQKIGNGAHAAAKAVAEDSEMLASLDKAVRSAFMMQAPIEISEDGEVVA
jgi:recombination protein RecA